MKIKRRLFRCVLWIWPKIQESLRRMGESGEAGRGIDQLCLNHLLLDHVLRPSDLFASPEIAVEAAISKAIRHEFKDTDPLKLLKDMLESLDMQFTPRWELIARAGMLQYRMGEFTKRVYHMGTDALDQNIPVNTISYRVCIERTLEELTDELQQINGLLDGMGVVAEPGDPLTVEDIQETCDGLEKFKGLIPNDIQYDEPLLEWHEEEPINFGRPVGSGADLTEDEKKLLKDRKNRRGGKHNESA